LKIGVAKAVATDSGAVETWIGPRSGSTGDGADPTTITTSGDITADAQLLSEVTAEPDLSGFSVLAAGGKTKALATQRALVRNRIGNHAQLHTTGGNIGGIARFTGSTTSTAASTGGAIAVTVSLAARCGNYSPSVYSRRRLKNRMLAIILNPAGLTTTAGTKSSTPTTTLKKWMRMRSATTSTRSDPL
jgi:hypothetical protein